MDNLPFVLQKIIINYLSLPDIVKVYLPNDPDINILASIVYRETKISSHIFINEFKHSNETLSDFFLKSAINLDSLYFIRFEDHYNHELDRDVKTYDSITSDDFINSLNLVNINNRIIITYHNAIINYHNNFDLLTVIDNNDDELLNSPYIQIFDIIIIGFNVINIFSNWLLINIAKFDNKRILVDNSKYFRENKSLFLRHHQIDLYFIAKKITAFTIDSINDIGYNSFFSTVTIDELLTYNYFSTVTVITVNYLFNLRPLRYNMNSFVKILEQSQVKIIYFKTIDDKFYRRYTEGKLISNIDTIEYSIINPRRSNLRTNEFKNAFKNAFKNFFNYLIEHNIILEKIA